MSEQCAAIVYKRDTYRRTGRTKSGFEMHYTKQRCTRRAVVGLFCWQHQYEAPPSDLDTKDSALASSEVKRDADGTVSGGGR